MLGSWSLESDLDFASIPAEDLKVLPPEAIVKVSLQWDNLTGGVNQCASKVRHLQNALYKNLEVSDNKIDSVDSRLDRPTEPAFADNCITAWDGIGYVNDSVAIMKQSVALLKQFECL